MHPHLSIASKISVLVFVVCVMMGSGARLKLREVLEPLKSKRLLITAFIVSYILVPLVAFTIVRFVPLDKPVRIGLMLLGVTAGSEALPKTAQHAKADHAFAVGLMFLQLIVTLIYVPLAFLIFMPDVDIEPVMLVAKLVLIVFLPLAVGLTIKARSERLARYVERATHWISSTAMGAMFAFFIALNFETVKSVANLNVAFAIALFLLVTFLIGYLLGGKKHGTRVTLGLGSCMRNGSISMVVSTQAFGNPKIIVTILLYFLVMVPVLMPIIILSARRAKRTAALIAAAIIAAGVFFPFKSLAFDDHVTGAELQIEPVHEKTEPELPPEIPPPHFARYKHPQPDLLLKNKKEHRYFTPMPIIGVDPDTGINLGAMVNFFDNGSKESPFFRYAPYRQQIAVAAYVTTKKVYDFIAYLDQPYIFDTPWRVRAEAELLHNPVMNYFGIANDGLNLTFPGTGQVFGSMSSYQNALDQVVAGQTNSKYDFYGLSRLNFQGSAEYDLAGGFVRPLFGFRVAYNWITDYTGNEIGGATQLPTHLRVDCDSGRAKDCNGGFDNYIKLGFSFDSRNFEPDPSSGILAQVVAELSPKFLGSSENYGRFASTLSGYGTIFKFKTQQLVLAGRFLYEWQFGDVPFYSMNTYAFTERDRFGLGGLRTIRGYKQDRFIGPVSLLSNMELRWSFAEFSLFKQHIKLEAVPFFDAGRPFENNSSMTLNNWKLGGGMGMRLAWNLSTIVVFDYGFTPEGNAFYMDLGHVF